MVQDFKLHLLVNIVYHFLNVFNIIDINLGYFIKTLIFNIVIGNFISKVVALPFLLIDDLRDFLRLFSRKSISKENTIPRSKFLSISASLAYGIPITSLTYGIISNNVYDYRVKRRVVSFDNLPKSWMGSGFVISQTYMLEVLEIVLLLKGDRYDFK